MFFCFRLGGNFIHGAAAMNDGARERELRTLAQMCRRQAKGATTFGAAAALGSMADSYERQADRIGAEPPPQPVKPD
jgi:hypothetical protein